MSHNSPCLIPSESKSDIAVFGLIVSIPCKELNVALSLVFSSKDKISFSFISPLRFVFFFCARFHLYLFLYNKFYYIVFSLSLHRFEYHKLHDRLLNILGCNFFGVLLFPDRQINKLCINRNPPLILIWASFLVALSHERKRQQKNFRFNYKNYNNSLLLLYVDFANVGSVYNKFLAKCRCFL